MTCDAIKNDIIMDANAIIIATISRIGNVYEISIVIWGTLEPRILFYIR